MIDTQKSHSFEGSRVLACHIEQRNKLESFILGESNEPPDESVTECHKDCLCAQWLHNSGRKEVDMIMRVNQVCGACEQFHSMASQALSLAIIGKKDLAREFVGVGGAYDMASAEVQRHLMQLQSVAGT